MQLHRFLQTLGFCALTFLTSCGKKSPDRVYFPQTKDITAIDFQQIPEGEYALKSVRFTRSSPDPEVADFSGLHTLDKPGEFQFPKDTTRSMETDWKGRGAKDKQGLRSAENMSVPLKIEASGTEILSEESWHYAPGINSNAPGKLEVLAMQIPWGLPYTAILKSGKKDASLVYSYRFGNSSTEGRGVAYLDKAELKLVFEVTSTDPKSTRTVELTYIKN